MKTDTQILEDVIAELEWEPAVNAAAIGVEVTDGIVTLVGQVTNYPGKWNAEQAAQRVYGVKALVIEIEVALADSARMSDSEIARAARNVLEPDPTAAHTAGVRVKVEHGTITLSGAVALKHQRQDAAEAIRHLTGVTGVVNLICIKSVVPSKVIKADVEAALQRGAAADGDRIGVQVNGGEVTLSGAVHSWSARDLAKDSAWSAPGVRSVVDHMTFTR